MIRATVVIPGVSRPHNVIAQSEADAIADALYALGMASLPEGSIVTTEPAGDSLCSSAT
jgi:hypothetical protein